MSKSWIEIDHHRFSEYVRAITRVEELTMKVNELLYENKRLTRFNESLRDCLDEKRKDIADLDRELREIKEKLSKLEGYNGNH